MSLIKLKFHPMLQFFDILVLTDNLVGLITALALKDTTDYSVAVISDFVSCGMFPRIPGIQKKPLAPRINHVCSHFGSCCGQHRVFGEYYAANASSNRQRMSGRILWPSLVVSRPSKRHRL